MAKKMFWLDWVAISLLIIGGLNWGLTAFNYNLVQHIFGYGFLTKAVYFLVGLSAIYSVFSLWKLGGKR
jgi:uncharacterized membrane protein YuzA (DUF378 family)